MLRVREQVQRIATYADVPTFVLGERGTGRSLVADLIDEVRDPGGASAIRIDCATQTDPKIRELLFGSMHTGTSGLLGRDSTIHFDEIGSLSLACQEILASTLEAGSFRPAGSKGSMPIRARMVSTASQSLATLERTSLRPDLFYQLAGFTIILPPLRERLEDIPLLARHFLSAFHSRHAMGPTDLSEASVEALMDHVWHDNIRELRGVIEQAAVLSNDMVIYEDDIWNAVATRPPPMALLSNVVDIADAPQRDHGPSVPPTIDSRQLRDVEKEMISSAFRRCGENVSQASRDLGIPRSTLRDKLRRYGII